MFFTCSIFLTMLLSSAPVKEVVVYAPPDYGKENAAALLESLRDKGFTPLWRSVKDLRAERDRIGIITHSNKLPLSKRELLGRSISSGTRWIFLRTPAFSDPGFLWHGAIRTRSEITNLINRAQPSYTAVAPVSGGGRNWRRSSNTPELPVHHEIVSTGKGAALHVVVEDLNGWETMAYTGKRFTIPSGHNLTIFYARGDGITKALCLEWREKDGSRWLATIALEKNWKRYVLTEDNFKFWESRPDRSKGRLVLSHAELFTVGVAFSHTGTRTGRHEYWIGRIGTAKEILPRGFRDKAASFPGLCPGYKFYNTTASVMFPDDEFPLVKSLGFYRTSTGNPGTGSSGFSLSCLHPRPGGRGLNRGRAFRFIPLLHCGNTLNGAVNAYRGNTLNGAVDAYRGNKAGAASTVNGEVDTHRSNRKGDDYRGCCAALYVGSAPRNSGSVWATFPRVPEKIAASSLWCHAVAAAAKSMADGIFFLGAGTERFTYFPDQTVKAGADILNTQKKALDVTLIADVKSEKKHVAGTLREFIVAPGEIKKIRFSFPAASIGSNGRITLKLKKDGENLDMISQEIGILRLPEEPDFITCRDGHFFQGDARWRANGLNYMPSSGIGLDDGHTFEKWLGGPAYDPLIIHRDLLRVRSIGFNAVSVFLYAESSGSGNLVDLLRQCRELDLKVNLSIRPGTPVQYSWPDWKRMIIDNRISGNDTVFTYDIAWEPGFRSVGARAQLDREWNKWVVERYGSIESGEKAWDFKAPRARKKTWPQDQKIMRKKTWPQNKIFPRDRITGPLPKQLWNEGPWHDMVCAYRRFVDDYLGKRYRVAFRRIKDVDKHHLVSYRMSESGDPTYHSENGMPFGFMGSARLMDFLAPEAYGRIGSWEGRVRPGVFTVAYGRAVTPGKPVIWAEAGMNIWNRAASKTDPALAATQGKYFKDFYRLLNESDSDGVFFWWYPGGFRVNENSDYGIINPDGSWRPATRIINRLGHSFLSSHRRIKTGSLITTDRDRYTSGLWGIWQSAGKDFLKDLEASKLPRVSLWPGNLTSANVPHLSVGNLPLKKGIVPKYLNGLWEKVEALLQDGTAFDLTFGGTVKAAPGTLVTIHAWIVNTAPCTWCKTGTGAVEALLTEIPGAGKTTGGRSIRIPIKGDIPYLGVGRISISLPATSESQTWTLELVTQKDILFGERLRIKM